MKISVIIEALTGNFETDLKRAQATSEKAFRSIKKEVSSTAQTLKNWALGAGIGAGIYAVVRASAEAEKAIKQLDAALASTGGTAGRSSAQLQKMAKDLQNASTFNDETIMQAETRLLHFQNVVGETFDRALQSSVDFAARFGKDLPLSAQLVGKALNDPVKGLNALSKAGVQFSASEKEMLKALAETNRLADAQTFILDRLNDKVEGAAAAARGTFSGAVAALHNQVGELLEAPDGLNAATDSVNALTLALADPRIAQGVGNTTQTIISMIAKLAEWSADAVGLVTSVAEDLAAAANGAAIGDLGRLNEDLLYLRDQLKAEEFGTVFEGGITIVDEEEVARLKALIAEKERDIRVSEELFNARERLNNQSQSAGKDDVLPPLDTAGAAGANARLEAVELELTKIVNANAEKRATAVEAAQEKIAALLVESMGDEARSVAELQKKYAELDKAVALTGTSAAKAAEIRAGLAAQSVKPLEDAALTDEARAVAALQSKYMELDNQVAAGNLSRQRAAELGATYAQQWADSEQRQIDEMEHAAGLITDQEYALRQLREEFEALDRAVAAAKGLGEGATLMTQPAADRIKQAMQARLEAQQEREHTDELDRFSSGVLQQGEYDLSPLEQQLRLEEDSIQASYDRRLEAMRASTILTNEEKLDLEKRYGEQLNAQMEDLDRARSDAQIQAFDSAFGQLASLMSSHNKTLFNIGKAAAIAQAGLSAGVNIAKASEAGFPQNLAFIAGAIAQIAQIASIIESAQPPAYDKGGMIPAGVVGLVAERRPEIVSADKQPKLLTEPTLIRGPAHITSGADTARYLGTFDQGGMIPAGGWGIAAERRPELMSRPGALAGTAPARMQRADQVKFDIPPTKNVFVWSAEDLANEIAKTPAGERMTITHVRRNPNVLRNS